MFQGMQSEFVMNEALNTLFMFLQAGFAVTLGSGGRDIDMESTVASDTVKVTLISNLVDLGSNGDFIGTA